MCVCEWVRWFVDVYVYMNVDMYGCVDGDADVDEYVDVDVDVNIDVVVKDGSWMWM